jgi:hypothetical protein
MSTTYLLLNIVVPCVAVVSRVGMLGQFRPKFYENAMHSLALRLVLCAAMVL